MPEQQPRVPDDLMFALGQITAELRGIRDLVNQSSTETNRRIDDLRRSINQRIDDHQVETDSRIQDLRSQVNKRGSAAGGLAGGLTSVLVEVIKSATGL